MFDDDTDSTRAQTTSEVKLNLRFVLWSTPEIIWRTHISSRYFHYFLTSYV